MPLRWYVVHAYSNFEHKVAESLKLNVWESIPKPVNMAMLRESLERLKASRDEAALGVQPSPQVSPE